MLWLSPMICWWEVERVGGAACLVGVGARAFFLVDCLDERELKINFRMKPSQAG